MGAEIKVNWSDLGDALNTKFVTQKSKKLVQDAWQGKEKDYANDVQEYKWSNTRDYTMVLITLTLLALGQKLKVKINVLVMRLRSLM